MAMMRIDEDRTGQLGPLLHTRRSFGREEVNVVDTIRYASALTIL